MFRFIFYRKVKGTRYVWFFVRVWVRKIGVAKLFGMQSFAEVKKR